MVNRLFLENTFLSECTATIQKMGKNDHGHWVTLDQTIFHAQGGGQPSDKGTINGIEVVGLFEDGHEGEIYHFISEDDAKKLDVGQTVTLKIDRDNRLELGALHTAGHLMAAVVEEKYPLITTKANQFPGQCSYEFKKASADSELPNKDDMSREISEQMQKDLKSNLPVTILFDQHRKRTIQVGEYPEAPCGGTHLSNTALIDAEKFKLRYVRCKKGIYKVGYEAAYKPPADADEFPQIVKHREKVTL